MNASATGKQPKGLVTTLLLKLANLIWWLLLAWLVLAALYAGLGRQLTQNINDYRPQIEQMLSERLKQDVRIGSLSSRWDWLNPTVIARNLEVRPKAASDANDEVIASLQSLRIGLDFLASLMRFKVVFSDFDANRLELVINQTADGEITIEGADLPEPVANDIEKWIDLAGQWLSDPSVRITRVSLGLRDSSGQLRQVEIPQLDLVYRKGLFYASGRAMQPGTTVQLASFKLVGRHFFSGDFTGQFYGDINSGRLFDGLVQAYTWKGIRAEAFDIGGQIWLTFRNGLLRQATGNLETPYLQLGVGNESLAPLENIQARFGWRRDGNQFHLNELSWRWNSNTVPGFDLRFQSDENASFLIADEFPIAPVRGLFSRLGILPDQLARALNDYRPSGTLNNLLLRIPSTDTGQFRLTADLSDIKVAAFQGAPAVRGLDGALVVNSSGGLFRADSAAVTFGFPALFRGLWEFRNFSADIAWRFDGDITRVYSDDFAMNFGSSARVTGAVDLKMVSGGEDVLGLRVGVEEGDAAMLAEFVPVHLVDPGLYSWLTTAIKEADIVQGTYFGHGRIDSGSPPGSFVSSMDYDFENLTVQYDDSWPEVSDATGSVFVHEGRTRIDLESGQTGGLRLRPGQVRVMPGGDGSDEEDADNTMVYINVAAPVTGDTLAYWMKRTPLGEMAGAAPEQIIVEGQFYLDLELGFALDSEKAPDVRAMVRAESGSLTFPAADLQWTDLSGEVTYSTDTGFSSAPVKARFLGDPVSVWFKKPPSGEGLVVRQTGSVTVAKLTAQFGAGESVTPGVSGGLVYQVLLELPEGKDPVIRLASDLTGVTIDWPEPLGKTASTPAPLDIIIRPGREGGVGFLMDWQQRINLEMDWQSDRVEVLVNDLRLGDRRFRDLLVEAIDGSESWLITVNADWIRGMTTWPKNEGPVAVDLEKLHLSRSDKPTAEEPTPPDASVEAFRELDFAGWPDIHLRIADLQIDGEDAGIWSFNVKPEASRFAVENIAGGLKSLLLEGALNWRIAGDEVRTRFTGKLSGGSLADLGALFVTEIPFRNEKTVIELDLDWPGRPDQFAVADLNGGARVRFDNGVILEGNNTAQLFRVFNLLNADTLWRRLKLDFSDLYEAGVAFDAISGKASLESGVLTLDPELQIVGPSGAFKFSGTTNLPQEALDMNMVVVLPLTQNLPLAALLLGAGAPIGGALFVLDKVLGDPLSKLASATYSVEGTWGNPDVELKRVFGDGK